MEAFAAEIMAGALLQGRGACPFRTVCASTDPRFAAPECTTSRLRMFSRRRANAPLASRGFIVGFSLNERAQGDLASCTSLLQPR